MSSYIRKKDRRRFNVFRTYKAVKKEGPNIIKGS